MISAMRLDRRIERAYGGRSAALVLVLLVALGCGATRGGRSAEPKGFLGDYGQLLEQQSDQGARLRYVRQGVDWASYGNVLVDPVQFWRSSDLQGGLTHDQSQMLVNYMHAALRRELAKGYVLVEQPGAQTLRISTVLTRAGKRSVTLDTISTVVPQLRLPSEAAAVLTGKPSFVGEVSFEGKVADARTGQVLGAALDTRVGGKTLKNMDSWSDVRAGIDYWARSLGARLCRASEKPDCG